MTNKTKVIVRTLTETDVRDDVSKQQMLMFFWNRVYSTMDLKDVVQAAFPLFVGGSDGATAAKFLLGWFYENTLLKKWVRDIT